MMGMNSWDQRQRCASEVKNACMLQGDGQEKRSTFDRFGFSKTK
jgi:hypothetical protein